MADDSRAAQVETALAEARSQITAAAAPDPVALYLPHLERSMKIVQRYAALNSDAPFVSNVPLFGPLIALVKELARRVLRASLRGALGSQAEFNLAVADILFEFTRRAAVSNPIAAEPSSHPGLAEHLPPSKSDTRAAADLEAFSQELAALRESVRAANLGAAEAERQVSELHREVETLKRTNPSS